MTERITGIIGNPVVHSLSPLMQNAAFHATGLPYFYLPFEVAPRDLRGFMKKIRSWKIHGLNVTIPHKEAVIRTLDKIDPEARAIGAVNTILNRRGSLVGFNTDAAGFSRSLAQESRFSPRGKSCLILGSGGVARGILFALIRSGCSTILIASRKRGNAQRLALSFLPIAGKSRLVPLSLRYEVLMPIFAEVDLLINATPVGLKGERLKELPPLRHLLKKALVYDTLYGITTPLLNEAKKSGLAYQDGLGMLLHQGALSFEIWTGRKPDIQVMRNALLDRDSGLGLRI